MKKTIAIIAASLVFFIGCKKDKTHAVTENQNHAVSSNNYNARVGTYPGVTCMNGMIIFDSLSTFRRTANLLASQYDASTVNDTTPAADSVAYNLFQRSFSYTSLDSKVESLRQAWYNTDSLYASADPGNGYAQGPTMLTFMNQNSAFKIGNSIYMLLPDFNIVEITDGSFTTYNAIVNGQTTGFTDIIVYRTDGTNDNGSRGLRTLNTNSGCKSYGFNANSCTYANGSRKIKSDESFINYPFVCDIVTTTKNFRKKGNGKWTSHQASSIGAGQVGTLFNISCSQNGNLNYIKIKSNHKHVMYENLYWGIFTKYIVFGGSGNANDNGGNGYTSLNL